VTINDRARNTGRKFITARC